MEILKAARFKSLMLGVGAVFGGSAAAAAHGNFELVPAIVVLIYVVFSQTAANLYHAYQNFKSEQRETQSTLNIHDRRIYTGVALRESCRAMMLLACTACLALLTMCGWWFFFFILALTVLFVITNVGSYPLVKTPSYILVVFMIFGPIATIGSCLVQSQHGADKLLNMFDLLPAIIMSVIIGVMSINYYLARGMVDMRSDLDHGRKSLITAIGQKKAGRLFFVNGFIILLMGIVFALYETHYLWWVYVILPVVCFFANYWIYRCLKEADRYHLSTLCTLTGVNCLLMGVVSYILLMCVGLPDDSVTRFF